MAQGVVIKIAMQIDLNRGLLEGVELRHSPHCDARPPGTVIDLLVLHGISLPPGEFGGPWIDALFTTGLDPNAHPYFASIAQLQVSAHLLIRRNGTVQQYVPFHQRAWHAGESCFSGRQRCNDFSIGIELEGTDHVPYSDAQYTQLARVIPALRTAYPALSPDRLVGHADIAPGRKTDPGPAFDWPRLRQLLGDS